MNYGYTVQIFTYCSSLSKNISFPYYYIKMLGLIFAWLKWCSKQNHIQTNSIIILYNAEWTSHTILKQIQYFPIASWLKPFFTESPTRTAHSYWKLLLPEKTCSLSQRVLLERKKFFFIVTTIKIKCSKRGLQLDIKIKKPLIFTPLTGLLRLTGKREIHNFERHWARVTSGFLYISYKNIFKALETMLYVCLWFFHCFR